MAANYQSPTNQSGISATPYLQEPPPSNMMMYFNEVSSVGSCFQFGERNCQSQELSLSLSTQIPATVSGGSSQYQYSTPDLASFLSHHLPIPAEGRASYNSYQTSQSKELENDNYLPSGFPEDHNYFKSEALCSPQFSVNPEHNHYDPHLYDSLSHRKTICNSKYLKVVQQFLDEVVNLQDALKKSEGNKCRNLHCTGADGSNETDGISNTHSLSTSMKGTIGLDVATSSCEISPEERQDLQNTKTKLMSMLEEVDRRFSQYYHQMHDLVSSFDIVAGTGAAKSYTRLALKTISRHFRCLRDAIITQIQEVKRSLGEQDTSPNFLGAGIPRLRYVDQQIRQDRVLHQLGVSRHSWRPQRGLPENSVSILRAWLFEHFLHPYPKESEKIMLARQTGLTRGQVANWFINARVRLWKPMVEEIYKEEFGDSEVNSTSLPTNGSEEPKITSWASEDAGQELLGSLTSITNVTTHRQQFHESSSKSDIIPAIETQGAITGGYFKNGAHGDETEYRPMKLEGDKCRDGSNHSFNPSEFMIHQNGDGGLMASSGAAYPTLRLDNLAMDSQVSPALVLRGQETDFLSMCSVTPY